VIPRPGSKSCSRGGRSGAHVYVRMPVVVILARGRRRGGRLAGSALLTIASRAVAVARGALEALHGPELRRPWDDRIDWVH